MKYGKNMKYGKIIEEGLKLYDMKKEIHSIFASQSKMDMLTEADIKAIHKILFKKK